MKEERYDFNVRPTSYWGDERESRMRIHRIKGEDRRTSAEAVLRKGEPHALASEEFDETLPDDLRELRGRVHPGLMSGEYLPDFEGDEVEIARVILASATGDVISIRARHHDGRIQ